MRIIAGEFRSRKLAVAGGFVTRPMPDRVRESVFGMLGTRVEDAAVIDLFAGSGAIGLEALSRGARSAMFVERDRDAAESLERNIKTLHVEGRTELIVGDALGMSIPARAPRPADVIFMDPPYPLVQEPVGWERVKAQATQLAALLADDGFLILRTPWPFVLNLPAAAAPPAVAAATEAPPPPPRALKRRKYHRPRERWEDDPFAESFQEMKRGAGRRGSPAPAAAKKEEASESDEPGEEDESSVKAVSVTEGAESVDRSSGVPADLSIPGCKGPETHVYGKTAVHWYMRARGADL